jgi:hypothetical protein
LACVNGGGRLGIKRKGIPAEVTPEFKNAKKAAKMKKVPLGKVVIAKRGELFISAAASPIVCINMNPDFPLDVLRRQPERWWGRFPFLKKSFSI